MMTPVPPPIARIISSGNEYSPFDDVLVSVVGVVDVSVVVVGVVGFGVTYTPNDSC